MGGLGTPPPKLPVAFRVAVSLRAESGTLEVTEADSKHAAGKQDVLDSTEAVARKFKARYAGLQERPLRPERAADTRG